MRMAPPCKMIRFTDLRRHRRCLLDSVHRATSASLYSSVALSPFSSRPVHTRMGGPRFLHLSLPFPPCFSHSPHCSPHPPMARFDPSTAVAILPPRAPSPVLGFVDYLHRRCFNPQEAYPSRCPTPRRAVESGFAKIVGDLKCAAFLRGAMRRILSKELTHVRQSFFVHRPQCAAPGAQPATISPANMVAIALVISGRLRSAIARRHRRIVPFFVVGHLQHRSEWFHFWISVLLNNNHSILQGPWSQ